METSGNRPRRQVVRFECAKRPLSPGVGDCADLENRLAPRLLASCASSAWAVFATVGFCDSLGRLADHDDLSILIFTLRIAALSTAIILPLGIISAWALARWRRAMRGLVETVLSLPLVLPPTAVGLLLLELLSRHGPIGRMLQALGTQIVFTWKAVVLATAVMSFPLLVRPVRAAFEEVDPHLINVARTLGATPMVAFARIAIPLSWRGILTGTILAFSRSLGEFGATIMIAGNIPGKTQTMALAIFSRAELGDDRAAMRLVALTVAIAFAAIWTTEIFAQRRTRRIGP